MDSHSNDPFAPLTADPHHEIERPLDVGIEQVCTPVPAHAEDPAVAASRLSGREPYGIWRYTDAAGRLSSAVARWNKQDGEKQILPLAWVRRPDGHEEWCYKHQPSPRPIYNLDQLSRRPEAPVLVCEGEKTADHGAAIFPNHVATTSPAGAYAAEKADWSVLRGRHVLIAPDANDAPDKKGRRPGEVYAGEVAKQAFLHGATGVELIDTAALSKLLPDGSTREGPKGWDLADAVSDGWEHDRLRTMIDTLRRKLSPEPDQQPEESGNDLPNIRVVPGELPRIVDEAETALIESGLPIFRRGGALVRLVTDTLPAARDRVTAVARFRSMCVHSMVDSMARAATFQRLNKQQELVGRDPPQKAADILLVREGSWRLPPVVGVITAPTFRRDGSLITQPGYDPTTGLFLILDPDFMLPSIRERPSREDAEAAVHVLQQLLSGFEFLGLVDEAVALSSLMTPVLRGAMSVAPLHAIRAYTPGTGKSHLVDVAAAISTGRYCPVITPGKSEEEMEKRLGALLREGVPIVSLDNVNGELGGDLLCQLTERPIVRIRVLGQSKAPEFECRSTVFATGNNLIVVGDMTRRTLLCTLNAEMERPEQRHFEFDPVERANTNRGLYVAAILTIVRAYRAAGAPGICHPLGSYGEWSAIVRSPLVWLGISDPVATMDTARAEDPTLAAMRELFTHWRDLFMIAAPFTAAQIIQFARDSDLNGDRTCPEFWELLLRIAGQRGEPSSRRLGKWLTKIKGRVVDGHLLLVQLDEHHGHRFSLVRATAPAP